MNASGNKKVLIKPLLGLVVLLLALMVTACGVSEPASDTPVKTIEPTTVVSQETPNESAASEPSEPKQQDDVSGAPGQSLTTQASPAEQSGNGILQVHFLNTGNSDSIFIETPAGEHILIDGADVDDGPAIVEYLKKHSVEQLAAVVATHPHADHIGGLSYVLGHIPVKAVYLPKAAADTRTFEDFIEAVVRSGAKRVQARAGVRLDVAGIEGIFYGPVQDGYEDLNNASAVLRLSYGSTEFLFMGDAEQEAIADILSHSGSKLQADVLKVSHHGSSNGISSKLLQAVKPKYTVILCGVSNPYGHPHGETLELLEQSKAAIYRTDEMGHIIAESNGINITFNVKAAAGSVEKKVVKSAVDAPAKKGTGNTRSDIVPIYVTKTGKKYHIEGCSGLSRSKIPITLKEAKAQGFGPCGNCKPPE